MKVCDHKKLIFNFKKLGAGTSLPSIVVRKFCNLCQIIITDNFLENKQLNSLIEKSLALNSIEYIERTNDQRINQQQENVISIQNFDWSNLEVRFLTEIPKINIIIGSDVFFESECKVFLIF